MDAKELRIGSWYSEGGFEKQIKDGDDFFQVDLFDSIPLTEEWLEKFGFEEEYYRGTRLLVKDKVRIDMTKSKFPTLQYWVTELKYVHQLQNLYFALTNTELKIKQHAALSKSNK